MSGTLPSSLYILFYLILKKAVISIVPKTIVFLECQWEGHCSSLHFSSSIRFPVPFFPSSFLYSSLDSLVLVVDIQSHSSFPFPVLLLCSSESAKGSCGCPLIPLVTFIAKTVAGCRHKLNHIW